MSELILELFSEEIPALMQRSAEEAYLAIFTKHLKASEIHFENIKVFSSPRRIAIHITGLPKFVEQKQVEIRGAKVGAPENAINGFCNSNGISVAELVQKEVNGQLFYFYLKDIPQTDLTMLLLNILPAAIREYIWPKSMNWGTHDISWVRPLKNIMCLFDSEILPVQFGHLTANNKTYGHRFMAPEEIIITSFEDYRDKLNKAYVMLDREERQDFIAAELEKTANSHEIKIKHDARLLEEVTGLVEWPVIMIGKIDQKFLKVPSEALVASMRTHQKYFSSYDKEGNFAPYFLFVSNIESAQPELVVQGNEKVLSARLSDALYFYEQDLSKGLKAMGEKLKDIVFHKRLGSVVDKVERVKRTCKYLAPDNEDLQIAASLCKNDLTSEMVGEFPELQGIMGYYYALASGLNQETAEAIKDHYKPLGPTDNIPQGIAAILAIAEKIDSILGLMLVGELPTGSGDPFGLKRMTLGVIRIFVENEIDTSLRTLIELSYENFKHLNNPDIESRGFNNTIFDIDYIEGSKDNNIKFILKFFEERIKYNFKDKYSIEVINAALDLQVDSSLLKVKNLIVALDEFIKTPEGIETCKLYVRTNNITKDSVVSGAYNEKLASSQYERDLAHNMWIVSTRIGTGFNCDSLKRELKSLSLLNTPIKNFFDNVLVNDPDPEIANNRLLLLFEVKKLFDKIAKFDQL